MLRTPCHRSFFQPYGALCLAGCLLGLRPSDSLAEGREYHHAVVRASLKVMPADIRPLFEGRLAELEERSVEPETIWPREAETRKREEWHYVHLDLACAEPTAEARRAAAEKFPRRRTALRDFSEEFSDSNPGVLPWILLEQYETLIKAFRAEKEDEIIKQAGILMHFAGDAAQSHALSREGDGRRLSLLVAPDAIVGDPVFAHRSPSVRFFGELLTRNSARYQRGVDLSPADYQPITEPVAAVFDSMAKSVSQLDALLIADQECVARMELSDLPGVASRADEFYQLLDERAGSLCVEQIRQGALLAANLVGGAWQAAGEPSLPEIQTRGSAEPVPVVGNVRPKDIIGSVNSNVFHFADCRFAKNISPENLVKFKSTLEARKQGRRQCRTCKPE